MKSTLAAITLLLVIPSSLVSANECLDCHRSLDFSESNTRLFYYYNDFANSVHGAVRMVCTDCHGGDPDTRNLEAAHVGVMDPVRFDGIVETCGRCHAEQRDAFQQSDHYRLLAEFRNAPNCVTCHGGMDVEVVNPGRIQATCAFCHNPQSLTSPDVPERAEAILTRIASIRALKIELESRAGDMSRVWALGKDYSALAGQWHAFDFTTMDAETRRLKAAYRNAKVLMENDPDY